MYKIGRVQILLVSYMSQQRKFAKVFWVLVVIAIVEARKPKNCHDGKFDFRAHVQLLNKNVPYENLS